MTLIVRSSVLPRSSTCIRQPTLHCVHEVVVRWLSHGRERKRYVLEVSAPTGHSSVTLPVKSDTYGLPVAVAMMTCAPRSSVRSESSRVMMSSKRTQRWQTMQRSSSSTIVGPRSTAFGLGVFGSIMRELPWPHAIA